MKEEAAIQGLQAIGQLPPEAMGQVLRKLAPVEVLGAGPGEQTMGAGAVR